MTNQESDPLINHIQNGERLRQEGRLEEAEAEYRAVLALDSHHVEIRQKLFDLSVEMGRAKNVLEELDDDFSTEGGLDTVGTTDPIERAQQDQEASREPSQEPPTPETVQDEETKLTAASLPSEQFLEADVTKKPQSNKIVLPTQLFEAPQSRWRYARMCAAGLLALAVVGYVGWTPVHEGGVQRQRLTKQDSSFVGIPKDLSAIPPDPPSDASSELDNPKEGEGQLPVQHKETAKRETKEPVPLLPDPPPPSKRSTVAESKESPLM